MSLTRNENTTLEQARLRPGSASNLPSCLKRGHIHSAALCLHADDGVVHTWSLAHFLRAERRSIDSGKETLLLYFTMGKATLEGTRLDRIEDALQEGQLEELRSFPERYESLYRTSIFIQSIHVELEEPSIPE